MHLPHRLALLGVGVYSSNFQAERRTVSEANKAMVRKLMETISEGNLDVVDLLFTPELARPMKRDPSRQCKRIMTGQL